jgi:A/G-specific adenine glycosylase
VSTGLPAPFPAGHGAPDLRSEVVRRFRGLVLGHWRKHARRFPWRDSPTPYHVLVSEIMLQQTRTETVSRIYPAFVARYPTLRHLAQSDTRSLLDAWLGLGYNRRALALRECARSILARHGGTVPRDPEDLRRLAGIGSATAASIAVFAFDAPVTFVETNIRRVFLYFFFSGKHAVRDQDLLPLVDRTLDRRNPGRWYSALMDYGVMLKRALPAAGRPDPNRSSAHYTRQAAYNGSDRQLRGRVLRILTAHPSLTPAQVRVWLGRGSDGRVADADPNARPGPARLRRVLDALVREGFLMSQHGRLEPS